MKVTASRAMLFALSATCALAVGLALVAQHRFDMQPCPWCILQRLICIALAAVSMLAALITPIRRALSGLGALLAVGGSASALWQHFVAAKSTSCAHTFADTIISGGGFDARWPEWFEVRANCSESAVSVLGVPFEFWALALFIASAVVLIQSVLTPSARA